MLIRQNYNKLCHFNKAPITCKITKACQPGWGESRISGETFKSSKGGMFANLHLIFLKLPQENVIILYQSGGGGGGVVGRGLLEPGGGVVAWNLGRR